MSTEQQPHGEAVGEPVAAKHGGSLLKQLTRKVIERALPGQPNVPWRPRPKKH